MLQIPDTVTSLAHDVSSTVNALAHDVTAKALPAAQAAAQAAGERGLDWGKQAVDFGRHNLQSAGVIPKRKRSGWATVLIISAVVAVGAVVFSKLRSKDKGTTSSPVNEATRLADSSHVRVA